MYVLTQPVCALTHETTPSWSGFLTEINTSKYMLDEKLQLKIDLLQDQIDNLEKSGHYTDAEIELRAPALKHELLILKDLSALIFLSDIELQQLKLRINNAITIKNNNRIGKGGLLNAFKEGAVDFIFPNKYGMSAQEYEEGKKIHNELFSPLRALQIEVVDAEILTPNHQEV
jgi:hypothetical protein